MKVLILTQYFAPEVGAPQIRLMAISQELRRLGHEVTVVTAMPNYPTGKIFAGYRHRLLIRESVDGIRVVRSWIFAATGRSVIKRLMNYFSFAASSLVGCIVAGKPDHVIVETPPLFLAMTGYLYSHLVNRPYSMYVSDLWPESARALGLVQSRALLWLGRLLERFLYHGAYRVASVTPRMCQTIAECGATAGSVVYLPNGVDLKLFQPGPARLDNIGEIPFLYAGTHGYAQGLDVVLRAAQILNKRTNLVFLFAGDGPERSRLERICRDEKIANVRFLGQIPAADVRQLFVAARSSIVPLRDLKIFESARPSKILPSLACGTPVIYSGRGDAADMLVANGCGLVVPPDNPLALARAVERLADDPQFAARLGRAGRRLVEAEYSWASIVTKLVSELQSGGRDPIKDNARRGEERRQ